MIKYAILVLRFCRLAGEHLKSPMISSVARPFQKGIALMKDGGHIPFFTRHSALICFIILLAFTIVLKLPSLKTPHVECDELIYITLAKKLYHTGSYNLQGTPILQKIAPEMYDKPLFFQPPLFILMSIPLVMNFSDNAAVILSWLGHILVLLSLFLFLRKILGRNNPTLLMVLLLAATDPIMVFASNKIWLDSLTAGWASLSMFLFWKACSEEVFGRKIRYAFFSSLVLGAAVLTKVTTVLLGPFYALLLIRYALKAPTKKGILFGSASLLPALALTLPWFLLTYIQYGKLIDTPVLPEGLIQTNPYIQMVISRPPYFYLKEIVLITPIILFPFIHSLIGIRKLTFHACTLWISFFSVIGGFTCFALVYHQAYVVRYLTLTSIPFYLILGLYFGNRLFKARENEDPKPAAGATLFKYFLLFLTLILNSMTCMFHIIQYRFDDLLSLYSIYTRLR